MFFHPKSENNNAWFKPWFNILLHTQSIMCATVDSQCLEYLGYTTLANGTKPTKSLKTTSKIPLKNKQYNQTKITSFIDVPFLSRLQTCDLKKNVHWLNSCLRIIDAYWWDVCVPCCCC